MRFEIDGVRGDYSIAAGRVEDVFRAQALGDYARMALLARFDGTAAQLAVRAAHFALAAVPELRAAP